MIISDTTNRSVQIALITAVAANEMVYTAHFVDAPAYTPAMASGTSNGTADVTVVSAPGASVTRHLKLLSVYNKDTAAATVIVKVDDTGTDRVIGKFLLDPQATLLYVDGKGLYVMDARGNIRATGQTSGSLIRTPRYLSAGTTYTPPEGTAFIDVIVVAAGGGGGGMPNGLGQWASSGGGGAGGIGYGLIWLPGACTYALGALGAGGAAGANNGTAGGDTTFTSGAVTITAKGGSGGIAGAIGTTVKATLGGAGGVAGTSGGLNASGANGHPGIRLSTGVGIGGAGGSGPWGSGGIARLTDAPGVAGAGNGSGGGGANGGSQHAGGNGTGGLIVIHEYR